MLLYMQGVQLSISAMDDDKYHPTNQTDDLIDILLIDHSLPIGEESMRQNYSGIFNFLTMDLSVKAVCAENFTGADCTQCVPGYTGELCDTKIEYPSGSEISTHDVMYTSTSFTEHSTLVIN